MSHSENYGTTHNEVAATNRFSDNLHAPVGNLCTCIAGLGCPAIWAGANCLSTGDSAGAEAARIGIARIGIAD